MIPDDEPEVHICYACESEFAIHTPYETDNSISFCPFCGSEIDTDIDDEDDDEEDDYK